MDVDALLQAYEAARSSLIGVSSGLAFAASHSGDPLAQEWAERWEAQYAVQQEAFDTLMRHVRAAA